TRASGASRKNGRYFGTRTRSSASFLRPTEKRLYRATIDRSDYGTLHQVQRRLLLRKMTAAQRGSSFLQMGNGSLQETGTPRCGSGISPAERKSPRSGGTPVLC